MTSRIQVLEAHVANKIAAGEVVERPAAVVKELVENAIDAGSTKIYVEIASGGKKLIRITDNGSGISPEDMAVAFERHATSKVKAIEDIYALVTLGFRGEALASIAAVSHVEMTSKQANLEMGQSIKLIGGKVVENTPVAAQNGTTIQIKDLFFNTPARMKFMKSTAAETGAISDLMTRLALSHQEVSFTYTVDQKTIFKTSGDGDAKKVIYAVLDKELAQNLIPVSIEEDGWKLTGFLSKLTFTKGNRSHQIFFVNQRYIKSKLLLDAVTGAYLGQLPIGRFPSAILHLEMPAERVDVNIHPAKTEVKFHNEMQLKDWLTLGLRKVIKAFDQIPEISEIKYREGILPPSKAMENSQSAVKHPQDSKEPSSPVHLGKVLYKQESTPTGSSVDRALTPIPTKVSDRPIAPSAPVTSHKSYVAEVAEREKFKPELLAKLNMADLVPNKASEMPEEIHEQTSFIKTSEGLYEDLNYIGQVFQSYLLFQKEGKLYVIDQHAGHEKILYEKFKREFMERELVRQILAKPILLEFSHGEFSLLMGEVEKMATIGFIYEAFGESAIVVREVPLAFHSPGTENFFRSIVDGLERLKISPEAIWKDRLIKAACKAAIKANDVMDVFEVKKLLEDLKVLEDPYTCPHGRPIIVTITPLEFEKMFKRT